MKAIDKLTELVAGKATVEKHELRALQRKHKRRGTEQYLRSLTTTPLPEPTPILHESASTKLVRSLQSQVTLRATPLSQDLMARNLFNFEEDTPAPEQESPYISTTGAPCITARDPSERDSRPNDRHFGDRDSSKSADSSQSPYVGVGRYRMSASATPEQQMERLRKNLDGLPDWMVEQLATTDLLKTPDEEVWNSYFAERRSRRNSVNATSPESVELDPQTGTRLVRGFSPSNSSSAASSARNSFSTSRRPSNVSPPTGVVSGASSPQPRRYSARSRNPSVSSPLNTISELSSLLQQDLPAKKIARLCKFVGQNQSSNALESDDEDNVQNPPQPRRNRYQRISQSILRDNPWIQGIRTPQSGGPESPTSFLMDDDSVRVGNQTRSKSANLLDLNCSRPLHEMRPQFRRARSRNASTIVDELSSDLRYPISKTCDLPAMTQQTARSPEDNVMISQQASEEALGSDEEDDDPGLWLAAVQGNPLKPAQDIQNPRRNNQQADNTNSEKIEHSQTSIDKGKGRERSSTVIRITDKH